jgi:hypothetical protein
MSHCYLLKAVRPEQPNDIPQFLLFRGFLLVASSCCSAPRLARRLSNRYHRSLLKGARLEQPPSKVRVDPGASASAVLLRSSSVSKGIDPSTTSDPCFLAPGAPTPPHCPVSHLPQPAEYLGCPLQELQSESLPVDPSDVL